MIFSVACKHVIDWFNPLRTFKPFCVLVDLSPVSSRLRIIIGDACVRNLGALSSGKKIDRLVYLYR